MDSDLTQGVGDLENVLQSAVAEFVEALSPGMRSVEAVMREVAQSEVPILLLAEKGAGKEATARRVHDLSRRKGQAFRVVQGSALESEKFAEPAGREGWPGEGTVFLEELAEVSARGQARLLQALTPGNGNRSLARLICGSARDLEAEVKARKLREDLYYRLSGVCLRLPPLRQRREDIVPLTEHFLRKYGRDFQRPVPVLSAETQRLFQEYSWPGNVRELENAAKAIIALEDETIAMGGLRAMLRRPDAGAMGSRVSLKQVARAASREAEKDLILRALTRTRWNRRRAAEELQISYKALLYKLKQIGYEGYRAS